MLHNPYIQATLFNLVIVFKCARKSFASGGRGVFRPRRGEGGSGQPQNTRPISGCITDAHTTDFGQCNSLTHSVYNPFANHPRAFVYPGPQAADPAGRESPLALYKRRSPPHTPPMPLDRQTQEFIIREAALEYYPPGDIAELCGLSQAEVERILAHPDVQAEVRKSRRQLAEDGEKFRLTARKLAQDVMTSAAAIAQDTSAPTSDRLTAMNHLVKWGGLAQEEQQGGVTILVRGAEDIQHLRTVEPWGSKPGDTPPAPARGQPEPDTLQEFRPVEIEVEPPP